MANNVAVEIEDIRARLEAIEEERSRLHQDAYQRREELLREEHRLTAELTALQDVASRRGQGTAEQRAASQTDITRTPRLPEKSENQ